MLFFFFLLPLFSAFSAPYRRLQGGGGSLVAFAARAALVPSIGPGLLLLMCSLGSLRMSSLKEFCCSERDKEGREGFKSSLTKNFLRVPVDGELYCEKHVL